jgi:hypothetical protein
MHILVDFQEIFFSRPFLWKQKPHLPLNLTAPKSLKKEVLGQDKAIWNIFLQCS